MQKFYQQIVEFAGRGTENINTSLYVKCQKESIDWNAMDSEEQAEIECRIVKEAAYLKGVRDGIRLSKLV